MFNHTLKVVLLATMGMMVSLTSSAWSVNTHRLTGAIAYNDLKSTNPELLAQVEQLIKAHPDYPMLLASSESEGGVADTQKMFGWLSRWADDIRGTPESRPKWHYQLRVVSGWTWLWPFSNGEASQAFNTNYTTLASPNANKKDRAVALSWLMHIVGDIQQPLHAGHKMASTFPMTDKAGLLAFVRNHPDTPPIDLHHYFDDILDEDCTGAEMFEACLTQIQILWPKQALSSELSAEPADRQFKLWLKQSRQLAKQKVYQGGFAEASAKSELAPIIQPQEKQQTAEFVRKRVALSGYRIAQIIRQALQ